MPVSNTWISKGDIFQQNYHQWWKYRLSLLAEIILQESGNWMGKSITSEGEQIKSHTPIKGQPLPKEPEYIWGIPTKT